MEEVGVPRGLRGGEADRAVARVLGDLRLARLTLVLEAARGCGTATVRSWITIDAVTYGMIPSAKIEKRASAPPLKRLSRPSTPPLNSPDSAEASTPGAGIHDPKR